MPCLVLRRKDDYEKATNDTKNWKGLVDADFTNLVQHERTLDETYFPILSHGDLVKRYNSDQVVTRENGRLLTVPQLRLWRFDDCVLTAYPETRSATLTAKKELDKIMWLPESYKIGRILTPEVLTGLIIAHHISKLGEEHDNISPPLDIFETSVFKLSLKVEEYLKLPDPVIEKEYDFMFEISDIREELVMIQEILGQQLDIVTKLIEDVETLCSKEIPSDPEPIFRRVDSGTLRTRAWRRVELSKVRVQQYIKRVDKIDANAERIEKRIQERLNLRRTFISIKDARASLTISTAIIGFTIITIIFAPLSFMTSLFALPIDLLSQNQYKSATASANGADSTALYSTRYVVAWFCEFAAYFVSPLQNRL